MGCHSSITCCVSVCEFGMWCLGWSCCVTDKQLQSGQVMVDLFVVFS